MFSVAFLLSTSDSRIKGSWQLLVLSFACIYFDPKIQHTFMTWSLSPFYSHSNLLIPKTEKVFVTGEKIYTNEVGLLPIHLTLSFLEAWFLHMNL